MTIRMYNLWGRRKAILIAICIALTITYFISAILMGSIMKEVYGMSFETIWYPSPIQSTLTQFCRTRNRD